MRQTLAAAMLVFMADTAHAAVVQNWVQNAHFDTNLAGWTISPQLANYGATAGWLSSDGIGATHSGSLRTNGSQSANAGYEILTQCITSPTPVPGTSYELSIRVRHVNVAQNWTIARADFYSGANCTGTMLSYLAAGTSTAADNVWTVEHFRNPAPVGSQSVQVVILGAETTSAPTRLEYDDFYFGPAPPTSCTASTGVLCLDDAPGDGRFRVFGSFSTAQGGGSAGGMHAIDLSSLGVAHGGLMWFFAADNPEMLVKVLNGCAVNDRYWVFLSAGTNVSLDLFVESVEEGGNPGMTTTYHNPDISPFPAVQDLYAFPCS